MPPTLALVLTVILIIGLFWRESRREYTPSPALWIPSIWLLILGSRSVTEWVYLGTPVSGGDITEGTPIDRGVYFSLIVAGVVVLARRQVAWGSVFGKNVWLLIFLLYSGISLFWSDFPFVGFKRWMKAFGDPIMVLIVLTDGEPFKALERVVKVCAFIWLPISILFIKYFPHLGRGFSEWTGGGYSTGITTNKNILGCDLMICGIFLVWIIAANWKNDKSGKRWFHDGGTAAFALGMTTWLFSVTDSMTSLLCLVIGMLVFWGLGLRNIRMHVGLYLVLTIVLGVVMESMFDLTRSIIEGAGRDSTFTGRTELWEAVLSMQQQQMFGYGFESFWLGDRLRQLQNMWGYFKPTQSHNGYIEMYVNLGYAGLLIMAGVIGACLVKMRKLLKFSSEMTPEVLFGRLGMAFLIMYLFYNYTEAAWKSLHVMFVMFVLFAIWSPQFNASTSPRVERMWGREEDASMQGKTRVPA